MKAEIVENKKGEKRLLLTFETAEERAFFKPVSPPRGDAFADLVPEVPNLRALVTGTGDCDGDPRLEYISFVPLNPFMSDIHHEERMALRDELAAARRKG